MLRSLNSGVTGLMNHQTRMDVIGNNIANVNTLGFKSRRVTFEESFNQLVKGASRSKNSVGGTDPMQVGLGVAVGSIDIITGQGGLQNTGRIFDLAIEGNAFFGVSEGTGTFYTRNGAFKLDADGYITLPTNGMVLQGKMADNYGNFPPGTAVSNLKIPLHDQSPAKETTKISLGKNLDADSYAKGSLLYTSQFLHSVHSARPAGDHGLNDPGKDFTALKSLYNDEGVALGAKNQDVINISWYNQASFLPGSAPANNLSFRIAERTTPENPIVTTDVTGIIGTNQVLEIYTLEDLAVAIETTLNYDSTGALVNNFTVAINDATGKLEITGGGTAFDLQVKCSDVTGPTLAFQNAFTFGSFISDTDVGNYPGTINNAAVPDPTGPTSRGLLRPAEQFDYVEFLRDSHGQFVGTGHLETGDEIDVNGSVGSKNINDSKSNPLVYYSTADAGTSPTGIATMLDDLMAKIKNDLMLGVNYDEVDGRVIPTVNMNSDAAWDDMPPPGAITIYGTKGKLFDITNLGFTVTNSNANSITPTAFQSALSINTKREAENIRPVDVTVPVYDQSGEEHLMTITFYHTGKASEWEWRATFPGKEIIIDKSNTGKVTFQDGKLSSWTYDAGGSTLKFDPGNGSRQLNIRLDVGGPNDSKGLVQYSAPSTANFLAQDGYTTGSLMEISIDEEGVIEGAFSNGTSHTIAQIMVYDFANPGGLLDINDSIFAPSANSGDPICGSPKGQSSSSIRPGSLEISNVDLAGEFTNMITTQRGYQANSRIITVSDSMLEELVNLKR
jgi:flagellar hook protein FlgE